MAATLDQLTGGRLVMFYDYGQQLREHRACHLAYPDDVHPRVAETVDGIRLIMNPWRADAAITASQGAYGVTDATCTPTPVRRPHPPIWFGKTHPGTALDYRYAALGVTWLRACVSPEAAALLPLAGHSEPHLARTARWPAVPAPRAR